MAPEIFQDEGVHSYYSDMWSLGCVLYELATGKPPFYSDSFKELVKMIQCDPTPVVENMTDAFNDLLSKLLEKEPT
jgi:serine/threonine-protein kinase ULK4